MNKRQKQPISKKGRIWWEGKENQGVSSGPIYRCPQCNLPLGNLKGSQEAVCRNCGYKEACCE